MRGSSIKEEIWIEKYRPEKLDDIVGQDDIIRRLNSYVKTKNLPHLLFSGPPGVGKTAAAISIVKEIFGETWRNNFIELNASDERGIDISGTRSRTSPAWLRWVRLILRSYSWTRPTP